MSGQEDVPWPPKSLPQQSLFSLCLSRNYDPQKLIGFFNPWYPWAFQLSSGTLTVRSLGLLELGVPTPGNNECIKNQTIMIYSVLQSYWSYKTSEQKKQMGSLSEKQIHNPPTVDPKCYHHNNLSKHLIKKSRQAKFCQPKKTSRTEDNLSCQPNHDTIHVFKGYLRQSLVNCCP